MATAHAKFTGEVGVCIATSSPGAFHLLNGLYDAKMDNQPVVAIVGQQGLNALRHVQPAGEQPRADVRRRRGVRADDRVARAGAGGRRHGVPHGDRLRLQPAVIILPHDVQGMEMAEPGRRDLGVALERRRTVDRDRAARASSSRAAADIINAGEKVTFLVGHGANGATDEVLEAARLAGAGIITALRGKQVVPSDVPYHTQQLGPARLAAELPPDEGLRHARAARHELSVRAVPAGDRSGARRPDRPEARAAGPALPDRAQPVGRREGDARPRSSRCSRQKTDLAWQDEIAEEMVDWDDEMEAQAMIDYDDGVNPRRVVPRAEQAAARRSAIVTADAGTTADWYGHHIRLRRGMLGDLSGRLATMLAAMPYAVAAKFALPGAHGRLHDRRRRLPDARHERAHHDQEVPGALGEPAVHRPGAAQRRPDPGVVGDAHGGRATRSGRRRRTSSRSTTPGGPSCSASRASASPTTTQVGGRLGRRRSRIRGVTLIDALREQERPAAAAAHHRRVREEHGARRS